MRWGPLLLSAIIFASASHAESNLDAGVLAADANLYHFLDWTLANASACGSGKAHLEPNLMRFSSGEDPQPEAGCLRLAYPIPNAYPAPEVRIRLATDQQLISQSSTNAFHTDFTLQIGEDHIQLHDPVQLGHQFVWYEHPGAPGELDQIQLTLSHSVGDEDSIPSLPVAAASQFVARAITSSRPDYTETYDDEVRRSMHSTRDNFSHVEFRGAPLATSLVQAETSSGGLYRTETRYHVEVPADVLDEYGVGLEMALSTGMHFKALELPNGHRLTTSTPLDDGDFRAFSQPEIRQQLTPEGTRVIVPFTLIDMFGPGNYTVITQRFGDSQNPISATAIGSGFLLAVALFVVGGVATVSTSRFVRQAQGRMPGAVRLARSTLIGLLIYGAAVLAAMLWAANNRMEASHGMTVPLLIAQAGLLVAGFLALTILSGQRWRSHMYDELGSREALLKELRRSNQDLEQFATLASHDLRAPLRQVKSFAQLLERRHGAKLDQEANLMLQDLSTSAKEMDSLVAGLLAFSKVGQNIACTEMTVGSAVERAKRSLGNLLDNVELRVTGDAVVWADGTLLAQALQNLLENAIKFRHPERACKIAIHIKSGPVVTLDVTDNGRGIPAQHQEHIFQLFGRAHAQVEGSGIGLAMVARVLDLHGGDIRVKSVVNEGTTFTLRLPQNLPSNDH